MRHSVSPPSNTLDERAYGAVELLLFIRDVWKIGLAKWDTPRPSTLVSWHTCIRFSFGFALFCCIIFSDLLKISGAEDVALLAAFAASAYACFYSAFDELPRTEGTVLLKTVYSIVLPLAAVFFAWSQWTLTQPRSRGAQPPSSLQANPSFVVPIRFGRDCLEDRQARELTSLELKIVLQQRPLHPPRKGLPSYPCSSP
jgi:hypothetical protein